MNRSITAAIAALGTVAALTGPALANDSLARSLDVAPGVFTTSELVSLKAARDDDNYVRINQIVAEAQAGGFDGGAGRGQEIALKAARADDDAVRIFGLTNTVRGETGTTFSSRGAASPDQLALSVGVEPGDLSTSDLVRLKAAQDEDDHFEISRILSKVN